MNPGSNMRRLLFSTICACVLASVLAGCDPGLPGAGVGVSLGRSGDVNIHVALCPDESLTRLELVRARDGVVGDGDDTIYWSIEREPPDVSTGGGFRVEDYVVGVVPEGFEETVKVQDTIPVEQDFVIYMVTTRSGQLVAFSISSLSRGKILSENEMRSLEGFVSHAEALCEQKAQA